MRALLVAVFVSLSVLPVAGATASTECADVHIVGIRGSGQSGFGDQVGTTVAAVRTALLTSGRSVTSESLDYPAISVSDSLGLVLLNGDYDRSVAAGAVSLRDSVVSIATTCPSAQIVVIGYSQGAQVVKSAFEGTSPTSRIAAVVLLADPTRDIDQQGVTRLGDPAVERSGSFGSIAFPDHLRAVAVDICAPGDGVCERGRRSFTAHVDGYGDAGELAVPYVLADLESSRSEGAWPR